MTVDALPRRTQKRKYEWDKWTDGKVHVAVKEKDFDCESPSFTALLHYQARNRRFEKVVTSTSENGLEVTFQFIKGE